MAPPEREPRVWPLLGWTGVILLVVLPWASFQDHSHWARAQWIPFVTPPIKLRDLVGNVVLYMPFGWLAIRRFRAQAVSRTVWVALVLSVLTEWAQVYSHGRFPSTTDVTCNVLGAWLGARAAARRQAGPVGAATVL